MVCNFLIKFIFVVGFVAKVSAGNTVYLDCFIKSLGNYRPNAVWISQDLMRLPFDDFEKGFKEVVDIFTHPDRRWFYFCDNQIDFKSHDYLYKSLWQCGYYDKWMSSLYVDLNNKIFFDELLFNGYIGNNQDSVLPFSNYIKQLVKENKYTLLVNAYWQFYAFYIDCLSDLYCQLIYAAYENIKDHKIYDMYFSGLRKVVNKLEKLVTKLAGSLFYNNYMFSVKRLKEILKFLEQEKSLNAK